MRLILHFIISIVIASGGSLAGTGAGFAADSPAQITKLPVPATTKVDFNRDIRPLFENRCYECHGPKKQKSGLRLDRKSNVFKGGDSGKPALLPGKNAEGSLIQRIVSRDPDE